MILAKLILAAAMVVSVGGAPVATTTAPTSKPATQATDPRQLIVAFLKGLEQLPEEERQGHQCGSAFKTQLSHDVADQAVDAYSTRYGRGLANLSEEEAQILRESLVAAWTAMVNYYRGYLMYDKARDVLSISMPGTQPKPFRMVVPTSGPAYPSSVEFVVECVQEKGVLKVNSVRILPLGRKVEPAGNK